MIFKKRRFFAFFFFFFTENEVLGDSWAPPWKSTPNESLFGRWPTKRVVCIRGAAERMAAGHNPPINEGEARAAPTVFWKSARQRGTAPSFLPPRTPYLHLNRIPRWGTMLYVYTILLWIRSIQPGQRHFPRINESPWVLRATYPRSTYQILKKIYEITDIQLLERMGSGMSKWVLKKSRLTMRSDKSGI